MKLLLDENLPVKLVHSFSDLHEVSTVKDEGWSGKKNGELLQLLVDSGFDALITVDKNIRYQQHLESFDVSVFILDAQDTKLSTLIPFIKELEIRMTKFGKVHLISL